MGQPFRDQDLPSAPLSHKSARMSLSIRPPASSRAETQLSLRSLAVMVPTSQPRESLVPETQLLPLRPLICDRCK